MADIITRLKIENSQYNSALSQAEKALNKFKNQSLSMNGIMSQGIGMLSGYAAGLTSVVAILQNNIETAKNFEASLSSLSSLTGMTGQALDDLKQKAINLSGSTTQSASQVVDAFKLIGSQKPELLKNAEGLNDVTKSAITLAEAAGMDVPDAATALTAALNIMGEGADQASRYINVLGAASKEGSVDINGLKEIIFKAGQAAKLNGLSFEEFATVAETIGPSFGTAAEAGTALNAMLLKLETQTNDKFKPSVVGFAEALQNLKDSHLSAAEATKLVTETGYKALVPILENIDALKDLQERITGTTTAEDQAATNADNLEGSLAHLSRAWEKLNLTINDGNGILRFFVDLATTAVRDVNILVSDFSSGVTSINQFFTSIEDGAKEAMPWLADVLEKTDKIANYFGFTPSRPEAPQVDGMTGAASKAPVQVKTVTQSKVYDDSTDKGLKEHIKALKEEREEVDRTSAKYKQLTQEITNLQKKLDSGKISTKDKTHKITKNIGIDFDATKLQTSDASLKKELSKWKEVYDNAGSQAGRQYAANMIDSIEREISRRKADVEKHLLSNIKIETPENFGSSNYFSKEISKANANASNSQIGSASWIDARNRSLDLQNMQQVMTLNAGIELPPDLQQKINDAEYKIFAKIDVPDEQWESIQETINSKLKELGIEPIDLQMNVSGADKANKDAKATQAAWQGASQAMASAGQALSNIEDPGAKVAGILAQAVASVMAGFATALASPANSSGGVWSWIAAAAAGMATAIATVSQIKAVGSYADGGVIGGNSYVGDKLYAKVNSGETILNQQQAQNALDMMEGGGNAGGSSRQPYVSGEMIYLGLNNWGKRTGRGELVFSR